MPRPSRAVLEAAALGLLHGPAELLPVSSSAHAAAVPWLLGWELASWPPARRKELEVALHAGTLAALAPRLWRARPSLPVLLAATAPPVAAGLAWERPVEERLGGPAALATGLVAGAAGLAAADRAPQRRGRASLRLADAAWLGLAQACALVPGVSRSGATLAAARARGFRRADASALSVAVAGPVLAGATTLKGLRLLSRSPGRRDLLPAAAGAAAAFASTLAAARALGLERRRALWPWCAERAALAGAILAVRYRRGA